MFSKARIATLGVLVAGALVLASGSAMAQATTSFQVRANVVRACTVSAVDLAFVNYDPLATSPLDSTSAVTVRCSKGTTAQVSLGNGSNYDTSRRMAAGGEFLNYELYQPSGYTARWGMQADGQQVVYTAANSGSTALTVNGRIPAGQDVTVGIGYADTIAVTVNY